MKEQADPLVSVHWLKDKLGAPDLRIVDATWYLPAEPFVGRDEYLRAHIPGAIFFDIDEVADDKNPLPHMLAPAEKFASRVRKMGIGDGATIVVYDARGLFSAARVWWNFRAMGHEDVFVLDGGLPAWKAAGFEVEDGAEPVRQPRHFTPRYCGVLVAGLQDVRNAVDKGSQILDARPKGRFEGREPEPRPGLRSGHMPGALNTPPTLFLNADGTMKSRAELIGILGGAGLDLNQPITCSCGSGVAASIVALALARVGKWDARVYDGSWTEWGGRDDTPVVTA